MEKKSFALEVREAEEILWSQDVNGGREGEFETAEGSQWENVLVSSAEDEDPPISSSKVPALST